MDKPVMPGKPGLGPQRGTGEGAEDWREVARRALRTEAAARGLGNDYDLEGDSEGIADDLIAALACWRGEALCGAEGQTDSGVFAIPPGPQADLVCARSMRCPACGQAGGRFILALADGRVMALDGDLTCALPVGEEKEETTALCGGCGESAEVGEFRRGLMPKVVPRIPKIPKEAL